MKRIAFILALLGCTFMGVQCEKDDDGLFGNSDNNNNEQNQNEEPTLPPATQSGKGTFGCKVNGEVWVPKAPPNINELHADYNQNEFFVSATKAAKKKNIHQGIDITVKSEFKKGDTFRFNKLESRADYINFGKNKKYSTDSTLAGYLIITHFDSSERIVSGKFKFKAKTVGYGNVNDIDTIKVTKGRFDIKKGY